MIITQGYGAKTVITSGYGSYVPSIIVPPPAESKIPSGGSYIPDGVIHPTKPKIKRPYIDDDEVFEILAKIFVEVIS